jgi:hypothetical protein
MFIGNGGDGFNAIAVGGNGGNGAMFRTGGAE